MCIVTLHCIANVQVKRGNFVLFILEKKKNLKPFHLEFFLTHFVKKKKIRYLETSIVNYFATVRSVDRMLHHNPGQSSDKIFKICFFLDRQNHCVSDCQ